MRAKNEGKRGCCCVVQGGTCLLIGDDHAAIGEMERLAREHIKCRPVRSSKYYRPKGHNQAAFNSLPLHVRTASILASFSYREGSEVCTSMLPW